MKDAPASPPDYDIASVIGLHAKLTRVRSVLNLPLITVEVGLFHEMSTAVFEGVTMLNSFPEAPEILDS